MLGKETQSDEAQAQVGGKSFPEIRQKSVLYLYNTMGSLFSFLCQYYCGYFQVQYHTFPTIEDTLFRQDLNGKGEFAIVLRTVSLNGFPILDGDDVCDEVDYFFFS